MTRQVGPKLGRVHKLMGPLFVVVLCIVQYIGRVRGDVEGREVRMIWRLMWWWL